MLRHRTTCSRTSIESDHSYRAVQRACPMKVWMERVYKDSGQLELLFRQTQNQNLHFPPKHTGYYTSGMRIFRLLQDFGLFCAQKLRSWVQPKLQKKRKSPYNIGVKGWVMDSMMRHFGLKQAVSGFLLVFDFHPWYMLYAIHSFFFSCFYTVSLYLTHWTLCYQFNTLLLHNNGLPVYTIWCFSTSFLI